MYYANQFFLNFHLRRTFSSSSEGAYEIEKLKSSFSFHFPFSLEKFIRNRLSICLTLQQIFSYLLTWKPMLNFFHKKGPRIIHIRIQIWIISFILNLLCVTIIEKPILIICCHHLCLYRKLTLKWIALVKNAIEIRNI